MKVEPRDQIIPCWIEKYRPESHCDGRETSARLESIKNNAKAIAWLESGLKRHENILFEFLRQGNGGCQTTPIFAGLGNTYLRRAMTAN